jgi:hypothetical protein
MSTNLDHCRIVNVVSPPTAANIAVRAITPVCAIQHGAPHHAPRGISQHKLLASLGLALLLAGCQASGPPGTSPATPASPTAYPDLASVPPRPQLGYTIEQRREIAAGLVADRANARYREAGLAYATGRADSPPSEPPVAQPEPVAASAPEAPPPAGDGTAARRYVEEALDSAADDDDLDDFVQKIERRIPDPYGPATLTQALGLAPRPATEPAAGSTDEDSLNGFGGFLGGVLGVEAADGDNSSAPAQR